jgi:hypothetical protein
MPDEESDTEQLERIMLRHALGVLRAGRSQCADCGRTPLAGEHVHLYGERRRIVCALCRPARREAPLSSQLVRPGIGTTVRLTARAA